MLYCAINTGFAMLVVLFTTPVVVLLVIPLAWLYGRVQGLFITTSRYITLNSDASWKVVSAKK